MTKPMLPAINLKVHVFTPDQAFPGDWLHHASFRSWGEASAYVELLTAKPRMAERVVIINDTRRGQDNLFRYQGGSILPAEDD